jgi:hypothetical protein
MTGRLLENIIRVGSLLENSPIQFHDCLVICLINFKLKGIDLEIRARQMQGTE